MLRNGLILVTPIQPHLLRLKRHVPRHQTPTPQSAMLRINHAVSPLGRLDQLRVLLLEDLVVLLGLPVPDGVGREDEVHFLEGALVRFGVEGPGGDDGQGVDGAEEVEGLFVELVEDGGEEEDLFAFVLAMGVPTGGLRWRTGAEGNTYRPAVTDRPTYHTPRVPPRTDLQGEDFGRVEPGHGQPGGTEDGCE